MTTAPNAERIYWTSVCLTESDQTHIVEWTNQLAGPRIPGPFPLPAPNRLQVGSGFPRDIARPILAFDKPSPTDEPLYEAYHFGFLWVVSDALRATLFEIDPTGFDSVSAGTRFPDGSCGPDFWLMDLVRFCDGYDVDASLAANPRAMERGVVNLAFDGHVFRAKAIGDAPFFRIPQSLDCLCTARAKQRVEAAGHTRLNFSEVGWAVW